MIHTKNANEATTTGRDRLVRCHPQRTTDSPRNAGPKGTVSPKALFGGLALILVALILVALILVALILVALLSIIANGHRLQPYRTTKISVMLW